MGGCMSAVTGTPQNLLGRGNTDGDLDAFHRRFIEDEVLGEGMFAQVKLVYDTQITLPDGEPTPCACKLLRKGVQFKDNVLYTPLKPWVLKGEVDILRQLAGQYYCLKLIGVYESTRTIHVVTEYCQGGEMMEYLSCQTSDLTTFDVSRIAYQLLSAVDHCDKHYILHRDIKPENIMFMSKDPRSDLRLIDFGSGRLDVPPGSMKGDTTVSTNTSNHSLSNGATNNASKPATISVFTADGKTAELTVHTTFAGTAFYLSPEMFQHSYTQRTDVWSVGVTLYVLVAGFPAEKLQKAFDTLQASKNRNLRKLPGMPEDLPDSFFDMLDRLLVYRHRRRPAAGDVLKTSEFVKLHRQADDAAGIEKPTYAKSDSFRLTGALGRHTAAFGFKKFERSMTALLAAMLSRDELLRFIQLVEEQIETNAGSQHSSQEEVSPGEPIPAIDDAKVSKDFDDELEQQQGENERNKLQVLTVNEIKTILCDDMNKHNVLEAMEFLENEHLFGKYAYHVEKVKGFARSTKESSRSNKSGQDGSPRRGVTRHGSFTSNDGSISTLQSFSSLKRWGRSLSVTATNNKRRSGGGPEQVTVVSTESSEFQKNTKAKSVNKKTRLHTLSSAKAVLSSSSSI